MVSRHLIEIIRGQFALDWYGIHGASHWARVRENGIRIATVTGADPRIVELFAFLHDSKRVNDGTDWQHGARAARFAASLRQNGQVTLSNEDLELLEYACTHHSNGMTDAPVTVQACWDADRLDLGRVGIRPRAEYLCTAAAVDLIDWAYGRSIDWVRRRY